MNYYTDRAIESAEEDLLGRSSFSKQVGQAIFEYNGNDSLVIGLFGKWGTGKTSVANMALETVTELSKQDDKAPVIIRFAPWNYSDKDNLITQFFSTLKTNIDLGDNEEFKNKVGKALSDYSGLFAFASLIPVIGTHLANIFTEKAKNIGDELKKPYDLYTSKKKLEEALIDVDQKIIVLIDDIDRLTNQQIRDIFQLVKQVGDLPKVIYVLAMDRDVVKRALEEVHKYDGNEYLEKIIQIPFEIPELRKSKLHNIFFTKLDEIIKGLSGDITWDQQYFNRIFNNCVEPYLLTLRDVNRVINTFQFRYSMLYEETSFEDMLGITTMEVLNPELYKWIAENKEAVCGGMLHGCTIGRNKPEENKKKYEAEFKSIGLDPEQSIMSVAAMFPVFEKDTETRFYEITNNTNIRKQMRAAQTERFELYFMFDMDDVKVSRNLVNGCVYTFAKDEVEKIILEINSQGNIMYFLDELKSMVDTIPYERLSLLASCFMKMRYGFSGEASMSFFMISANYSASYLVDSIIRRLETNEERYELYKELLINASDASFGTAAYEIRKLERSFGRFTDELEKTEDQLVSLEQLNELEQLFLSRIESYSVTDTMLDSDESAHAFYLWEDLDKENAQKYINRIFKDPIRKLKFICRLAGKWSGTNGTGWSFVHSNFSDYTTAGEIYESIQQLEKGRLDEFTETEQIKLASYYLDYNKDEFMHVTEQQAMELVKKWKE